MEFEKVLNTCSVCMKCDLSKSRINVVFGRGARNPDLLLIGEAPGKNEDEQGIPFCGRAGDNLNKLLIENQIDPDKIFIANILKCRPPKNRDPTNDEMEMCTPYLVEQIKLLKPKIICTLGNFSSKFILANGNINEMKKIQGVGVLHGKLIEMEFRGVSVKVVPIYHPAAIIYRPRLKDDFFEDFKLVKSLINN